MWRRKRLESADDNDVDDADEDSDGSKASKNGQSSRKGEKVERVMRPSDIKQRYGWRRQQSSNPYERANITQGGTR